MKTILITGGTDGMGRGLAMHYLRRGDSVVVVGHSQGKGDRFLAEAAAMGAKKRATYIRADLSLVSENRRVIKEVRAKHDSLDSIVLAAASLRQAKETKVTGEGFEFLFALMYVSRYILSYGLTDLLEKSPSPVILNIAAPGMKGDVDWNAVEHQGNGGSGKAQFQSSRLNDLLGVAFAERQKQSGAGGESMSQTPAKPTAPNFSQLTPGADGKGISKATLDSYDMLSGSWPKSADDVVLVLDRNNSLSAGTMYQLGLITADQYKDAAKAIEDGGDAPAMDWDYGDLVGREFTLTTASDRYKDDGDGTFTYLADGDANWDALRTNGRTLKISGVIRPMEDAKGANIVTAVAYTPELTDWMIDRADDSAIVKAQESKPDTDVLTGQVFADGRTADDNLAAFGKVNTDAPSSISIYTDSFDDKEAVSDAIKAYNDGKDEDHRITYTDYVALMTSSITTIVNVISYVLIAFVAVSLVVSCIMIGIITRISVLERTKEIGILRALGASKRNVSQVFNAETIIVGLASGLLGVGVTALLTIPANMVVSNLLGAGTLSVGLPIPYAIVLVAISVLITLIGGFLPARKAAKQDPVIALRTE
ncbi:hypothetical protein EP30_05900 [Bifidobacterium sp. UTCIF-39]|uniref:SDR family NAD(P)-dependent oxidoreductase n=1 Tax=Bifidobacterium sp. UTCIF-39 TaxID=1465359 RepID=UPI001C6126BD|nr:SDR family NAD(P)-dependent oxidoreductase [Bifidobacterium sp. UTCIF-39]TPF96709.1 hypothetical protein EP30_05900 [Bifidobacterium sp. UTCIF-39]